MSLAIKSQGFKLEIGNGDSPLTYTEVKEIVNFNTFDGSASEIDTTHTQSTAKEFLIGLQDHGSCSFDANYLDGDAGQDKMRAAKGGDIQDFKLTFSDASTVTFQGFVTTAGMSGGVDGKVDTSFGVRVSGDITFA